MEVRFPGVDGKEVVLDLPNYYYDLGYKKGFEEGFKEGKEEVRERFIVNLLKNPSGCKSHCPSIRLE
ncbi:hypothetical protein QQ991_04930 [Weizmannia coagulans]|uniref:Uncharacterized protein n=1 Tax=Heyndrickxia coagulans TaxID=1398 RepID=A0A0C5CFE4_HEYCO|nr:MULTISPECIES: hypothetical protein [Heyndrickxia]AJO24350.1 hypothetical protein SB48_HM08orf05672 [Heyndrickxia coagulans]AKN54184.1 hypothetical protein AB434_1779 [Heyndrickxia coagulans]KYC62047.1 hypothetical protein B4099_0941 [Heyndrickxia coagulans]MCR4445592.1 hypothetical protein [Heyndrickxia coagulans]MCW8782024.1 hypothetical protein [Heyndrickxia coagulans]